MKPIVGLCACAVVASLAGTAAARPIFDEVEPNNSKAAANAFTLMDGDSLRGTTTGASTAAGLSSLDYFLITNTARPLGIYRHRLVLTTTGTAGHTGSIRGLTQSDGGVGVGGMINAGTDATAQSSSASTTPARFNQWYGFGKQEQLYYRVAGTSSTTGQYLATLETEQVVPTNIGIFPAGPLKITTVGQGHSTDTDFWIYDENLNAIDGYGNDDTIGPPSSLQSTLTRNYAPGVYYIAISNFNIANNKASPGDDNFRSGTVLDFPDIILNSSTTGNLQLDFAITAGGDTIPFKQSAYDIWWGTFTVIPAPGAVVLLGLGGLIASRRRRA